jgi:hypothetical protein
MMFGKLYPRMYTGVVAGLIDGRHHKRLGPARMLFEWCIMRQTGQGINPASGKEEGVVCRGAVVTYAEIAEEMNSPRGSVREWMARLINEKYVRTERDRRGLRIFVRNPKKFRVSEVQHSKPIVSAGSPAGSVSEVQHSKGIHPVENKDTSEKLLRNDLTKLLRITTLLRQRKPLPSLSCLAKEKSIPRAKTERELDERRRLLLKQSEEIQAKYAKPVEVSA